MLSDRQLAIPEIWDLPACRRHSPERVPVQREDEPAMDGGAGGH